MVIVPATHRSERMSLIGLGCPVPSMLPDPDNLIRPHDRAMLIFLYSWNLHRESVEAYFKPAVIELNISAFREHKLVTSEITAALEIVKTKRGLEV